jgi:hypothetical protein
MISIVTCCVATIFSITLESTAGFSALSWATWISGISDLPPGAE